MVGCGIYLNSSDIIGVGGNIRVLLLRLTMHVNALPYSKLYGVCLPDSLIQLHKHQ